MAFYDYACGNCGFRTTISKPMSKAGSIEICPRSDSSLCTPFQPMERVYDAPPAARIHMGTPQFHSRRGSKR